MKILRRKWLAMMAMLPFAGKAEVAEQAPKIGNKLSPFGRGMRAIDSIRAVLGDDVEFHALSDSYTMNNIIEDYAVSIVQRATSPAIAEAWNREKAEGGHDWEFCGIKVFNLKDRLGPEGYWEERIMQDGYAVVIQGFRRGVNGPGELRVVTWN